MRRICASVIRGVLLPALVCIGCSETTEPVDNLSCSERPAVTPAPDTDPVGTIRTWAGTGQAGYDGDCNSLLESSFYLPLDVEFTPNIGTYIVDWNNHRIRKLNAKGRLVTVVGADIIGDGPTDLSDQTPPGAPGTSCRLNHPTDVFERSNGTLAIVSWHNHKLRQWDPATGLVYVMIGREANCTGDGGLASAAKLNQPPHAVEAADGSIYIVDQRNQCVRKIDASGNISTVVSTPSCNTPGGFSGDGGDPTLATINMPTGPNPNPGGGIAIDDTQGRLYIADTRNHRIRVVDFGANTINTAAGNGTPAYAGDGGDPLQASINLPADIELGPDGRLYIADSANNVIRAVDFVANEIVTVAGTGQPGFDGDGGPATQAKLNSPWGIAFDQDGHLYITDTFNNRIRRVRMN